MLLLVYSHVLAFSVFFINSMFDLFNDHDVPDLFGLIGIFGGLLFHAGHSYVSGSLNPLFWSLGFGGILSVYGWFSYWRGLWGGADAMMLSALGFMVPGPVSGVFRLSYVLDLMVNFMFSALAITVVYSIYKFWDQDGDLSDILIEFKDNRREISMLVLLSAFSGFILAYLGSNGALFFAIILGIIFLYRFMKLVEREFMVETKKESEVEVGEVPSPGQGFGRRIRGLEKEELEEIDGDLEVRTGVPFIPVFLLAVLLTDLTGSGIWLLYSFY